jgi:predicted nuclease of predicted toxin-antitoxin system
VRLLFDENLSRRLVADLAAEYPGSTHVEIETALGRRRPDEDIWDFARASAYAIVSKDNDFRQRAFLLGPPPKVVWLSVGNAGTDEIAELLRVRVVEMERFAASPDEALLVLER